MHPEALQDIVHGCDRTGLGLALLLQLCAGPLGASSAFADKCLAPQCGAVYAVRVWA